MPDTLAGLLADCEAIGSHDPDYYAKYLHRIPDYPSLDRRAFILARCRGNVVVDIGGTGLLHDAIVGVARRVYTIDRTVTAEAGADAYALDLDTCAALPVHVAHPASSIGPRPPLPLDEAPDVVVCGEVIEHLGNPLRFLQMLRAAYPCEVIITTPNAFGESGFTWVKHHATENVNDDHVAYYSYHTLHLLLRKAGYTVREFAWYGGAPRLAEGMIAVVRGDT